MVFLSSTGVRSGGYLASLFANRRLEAVLMRAMPTKKTASDELLAADTFPARNRK
jgi:hypothetical protein